MSIKEKLSKVGKTLETLDFTNATDTRTLIFKLLNIIEEVYEENEKLRTGNQMFKDEINKLKGQKGKPKIKGNISSEVDPQEPNFKSGIEPDKKKPMKRKNKNGNISIHQKKVIHYTGDLPKDARHKGYRKRVVQGIKIEPFNTEYCLERFYSESTRKLYEGRLPQEYQDGYDPSLKAWIITCYYDYRIPEEKILNQLNDIGIRISAGHISNILIKNKGTFHAENEQILSAGISSSTYQHMDDTGARVNGVNHYFSVLCNEFYSAFFINRHNNRLTVLKILNQGDELQYTINEATIEYLKEKNVPRHILRGISNISWPESMIKAEFINRLKQAYDKIKPRYKDIILEAAAVTFYQEQNSSEKIKILLTDAAKQFGGITELNALCWVHEDRHYAKLIPVFKVHKDLVEEFRRSIWDYDERLKAYKCTPNNKDKKRLDKEFDKLFSKTTGYDALDECIGKTLKRKSGLLVVLDHSEVPLHNNPAELAVREYVIKRKISMQTRSEEGTRSWETFLSIKDTCRKLGVNFREYLHGRLSGKYKLLSLAEMIQSLSGCLQPLTAGMLCFS